jgi:hypothetical protein
VYTSTLTFFRLGFCAATPAAKQLVTTAMMAIPKTTLTCCDRRSKEVIISIFLNDGVNL